MQINTWIDAGIEPLSIAVNISGVHLRDPDIVNKIVNVCQYFDIPRNLIELEITESVMLEDIDDVMKKAIALKQAGFKLSMDDFGTGFSSLSILKKPVSYTHLDVYKRQSICNCQCQKKKPLVCICVVWRKRMPVIFMTIIGRLA